MDEPTTGPTPATSPGPEWRKFAAMIVIATATALNLGLTLNMPANVGANDISRWCTVWSLLERGTYAIDDAPWQHKTQDKVKKADPFAPPPAAGEEPVEHFYSSKPPLLPTIIAGLLYPVRRATGVEVDRVILQERAPRNVQLEGMPFRREVQTPDPVEWSAHVFYFNPIVVLFGTLPYAVFLALFALMLDRHAPNDWAWLVSLVAAAWGTYLFNYNTSLNNHTIAAYSGFFAIYNLVRLWPEGQGRPIHFLMCGFFAAFCACNELPAALFGVLIFLMVLVRAPRPTLLYFVPAAAVPCIAFLATQYIAMGSFTPAYDAFGTEQYRYEGSVWNTPLEMDYLNEQPEPHAVYLFHMTFGHHGVFSLTPITLFALYGLFRLLGRRGEPLRPLAWLTLALTVAMIAFYAWNPKARNYGGSAQGMRWLLWLFPFWLVFLPAGLEAGQARKLVRRLSLLALAVSVFSVGYALRNPWSHPWILDMLEHLNLYTLKR